MFKRVALVLTFVAALGAFGFGMPNTADGVVTAYGAYDFPRTYNYGGTYRVRYTTAPYYPGYGPPYYPGYGPPYYPGYGPPYYHGYGPPYYPGFGPPYYHGYGPPYYGGHGFGPPY
jgi:hypothetical protein